MSQQSIISTVTKDQLIKIITESLSVSDALRRLGYKCFSSGNARRLKARLTNDNISIDHFQPTKRIPHFKTQRFTMQEVLVKDSKYMNISCMKKRLLRDKLLQNKCTICGQLPEWNGEPLTLILDHINGKHNDHRLENLRMVCGNCNSQLDTHAGRNKGKG